MGRWTLNLSDEMAGFSRTRLWVTVFVDFDSRRRLNCVVGRNHLFSGRPCHLLFWFNNFGLVEECLTSSKTRD